MWSKFSNSSISVKVYHNLNFIRIGSDHFFDGWSWLEFNNLGLALGTNLKFYTTVAKGLKLKVKKFWGLIPTFAEVTEEKLVGAWGFLSLPPHSEWVIGFRVSFSKKMQIYIYISFARFSVKGFSILANTSFADLTASVMQALSNPFRIDSFCCFRYVYISTIQCGCRGFKSDIFNDTFTSPGATLFFNCSPTRSA